MLLAKSLLLLVAASAATVTQAALPVFFFHGSTGNHTNGDQIGDLLKAQGRSYVPLSFCERACSVQTSMYTQVQMAIQQLTSIIASDKATYANGYHFIGHSTGGVLARGVAEEWDNHNIHSIISLAGDGNGNFYGPQAEDLGSPLQVLLQALGPYAIAESDFNFTKYAVDPTTYNGKFQRDYTQFVLTHPDLQKNNAVVQSLYPPVKNSATDFLTVNPFYPKINNLINCGANATCHLDQQRRKRNFLKLKAYHLFASPNDDIQVPWQTSLLGKYSDVATVDEIETKFASLRILNTNQTQEYTQDLYGLKTLDKTGRMHLHPVPGIGHNCWLFDYVPLNTNVECKFLPNFQKNVYPTLV